MFKALIISLCLSFALADTFWFECSDFPDARAPRTIISAACEPGATHCTATRGEPLEADAYVTPAINHQTLRVDVSAFILGLNVTLPPQDPNACNNIHTVDGVFHGCPVQAGVEYIWKIR